MSTEPDDLDARAADYVMGLMSIAETDAVRAEKLNNPALAQAIGRWESHLAPLAAALTPEPPPASLWQRIDAELSVRESAQASITPLPRRRPHQRVRFWQFTTGAAAAIAAGLAILLLGPATPAPHYATTIAPTQGPAAPWLAETRADGALVVTALAPADHAADKSLELWALAPGSTKPVSLGVLPATGAYIVAAADLPRDRLQLLVSLEPAGGSPSGQPTGPVLYAGALTRAE